MAADFALQVNIQTASISICRFLEITCTSGDIGAKGLLHPHFKALLQCYEIQGNLIILNESWSEASAFLSEKSVYNQIKKIQMLRIKFKLTKSKQFRMEFIAVLILTSQQEIVDKMDLHVYSTALPTRDGRGVPTQNEPALIYLILYISVCQTLCCLSINKGQFQPCCEK